MQWFLLIFLAPVILLPGVIALWTRKRQRALIVTVNLILVPLGLYLLGVVFPGETLRIPVVASLLTIAGLSTLWLVLLHAAIRKDGPTEEQLDEPVELAPHDGAWAAAFAAERQRLAGALAVPPDSIEHIGSTAVPDLPAKPVIDMMLGVPRLDRIRELVMRAGILGYENLGEAGVTGRVYLRLRGGEQDFNLHLMELGGEHWKNNLALREFLRADPAARARYADAKARALETSQRLIGYSHAKNPAVAELIAQARQR